MIYGRETPFYFAIWTRYLQGPARSFNGGAFFLFLVIGAAALALVFGIIHIVRVFTLDARARILARFLLRCAWWFVLRALGKISRRARRRADRLFALLLIEYFSMVASSRIPLRKR